MELILEGLILYFTGGVGARHHVGPDKLFANPVGGGLSPHSPTVYTSVNIIYMLSCGLTEQSNYKNQWKSGTKMLGPP